MRKIAIADHLLDKMLAKKNDFLEFDQICLLLIIEIQVMISL